MNKLTRQDAVLFAFMAGVVAVLAVITINFVALIDFIYMLLTWGAEGGAL
jgi:hypothetical protein